MMRFADRTDAGRRLAVAVLPVVTGDVVVVGVPRGGVPVALEIAEALAAPLDVIVVRKLGVPFQPELGMGAVGEGGTRVIDDRVVRFAGVTERELGEVERRERAEVERRAHLLRAGRPPVPLAGRTVVVVDDGIATGSTARAACRIARAQGAGKVVLAVPVAPADVERRMRPDADDVICCATPRSFRAIGQYYDDFTQVTDDQVVDLLQRGIARATSGAGARKGLDGQVGSDPPARNGEVVVEAGGVQVAGNLTLPVGARGIVLFAHGSGSSRHSPRNRYVAAVLDRAGLGTLVFDLLTAEEEADRANVFDIDLLAHRLLDVTTWLTSRPTTEQLRVGYFGASTGAAAALSAAADPDAEVAAIVSRGGRPDLAGAALDRVRAPTLLIVGGNDEAVLDLNRAAQARLRCENRLAVVPGATHLFEEPGALGQVADLAAGWFTTHLAG